jgi:hypothetical protein
MAAPRRLNVADAPVPPPAPVRAPQAFRPVAGLPQHNPLVDQCVAKAQQIEPSVQEGRIKGRIDTILASSITELLDFGNRNLAPLQDTSARQARMSSEMARIDAAGWLTRAKEASCKPPSMLDRFSPPKPPTYWEGMLGKARAELLQFVRELEQMKKEFVREVTDLHLDAIAMIVCSEFLADDQAKTMAHNRGRSLLQAHQTAAMVQATLEQSLMLCVQHIQQIDQFNSVALPQWKAAFGSHP